jgi:ABC-type antimicrobial peptide transport system permease subunit
LRFDVARTLDEKVNNYLERERLLAFVSATFGMLALLLAAVGGYGVISYGMTRRASEIALRTVLGVDRSQVVGIIIRDAAILPLVGLAVGVPAAIATSRVAKSLFWCEAGRHLDSCGFGDHNASGRRGSRFYPGATCSVYRSHYCAAA